jgi:hypothetical protein
MQRFSWFESQIDYGTQGTGAIAAKGSVAGLYLRDHGVQIRQEALLRGLPFARSIFHDRMVANVNPCADP